MSVSAIRRFSRRGLLAGSLAAGLALAAARPSRAAERTDELDLPATGTHLLLLGTHGTRGGEAARNTTAQVVLVAGRPYVVDCGYGAARQLVKSGVKPEQVRQIFITHHHADHNADYGAIVYAAWLAGARPGIEAYGPPPLASLTQLMVEQHAAATQLAASPERPRLAALIEPHQITQPGRIFEDDRVRVTAALVEHPPISPAFAYRFDAADRSIVFSGDTLPGQDLELLAQGATVLVHAVYDPQALQDEPAAPRASLANGLTAASEAGRIAANAGVATLVLTHLGDEASPSFCRQEAARYFDGEIIVGHDLQLI